MKLTWKLNGWTHNIKPEGIRWRWTARYQDSKEVMDFGLIPGGAAVAIEKLLEKLKEWKSQESPLDAVAQILAELPDP